MAPGRILKLSKNNLLLLVIIGLIMASCGTAGSARNDEPLPPGPKNPEEAPAVSQEFINILEDTRSELDDVFVNIDFVPAYFLQNVDSGPERDIGNPYAGFRVQIISTRDVSRADSVANAFRIWADSHILGYFPQTYVVFDQPYYKVHVGNFQFQHRAAAFTQLLKTKYPSAWVVHDRIDPKAVPRREIRVVE